MLSDGPFEVIYQDNLRKQAEELLWTLKTTAAGTNQLLGSSSKFKLSVVLNGSGDSGNGYVTPFPFKSEIESGSIRGRSISRKHPSWTQLVTSHELVHAAQAEYKGDFGFVSIIHPFAPDIARALNMFVPPGFSEGIAVVRESEIIPGAGRANHAYFNMQFRASMDAREGLTLSQLLDGPSYTRPFDSYYQGGTWFATFLREYYGPQVVADIMNWQQKVPFLGFGANLIAATGESPRQVRRRFQQWYDQQTLTEEGPKADITRSGSATIISGAGRIHRKPQWFDNESLAVYSLGYNLPRGFSRIGLDGSRETISINETTDDAVFQLQANRQEILYSRFEEHPTTGDKTAYSFAVNTQTGQDERISGSKHTFNPVRLASGSILALLNRGPYSDIVDLSRRSQAETVLSYPVSDFVALIPRGNSDSLAVVLNIKGKQALFLMNTSNGAAVLSPWIGFENGTIYDGAFSASGKMFTFTSDHSGILNVYALDTTTEQIWQVTDAKYGAMEPQVSPDGRKIAYVSYEDQRFNLIIDAFDVSKYRELPRDEANYTWATDWEEDLGREFEPISLHETSDPTTWTDKKYRAFTRMAPRMVYPTLYKDVARENKVDASMGFGIGLALQGTDPVAKWAYHAEGIVQRGKLWGEVGLRTGLWAFRPSIVVSHRGESVQALVTANGETVAKRVIRDRTSMAAGVLLPYVFSQNVARTSLTTSLQVAYRNDAFLDDDFNTIRQEKGKVTFLPSAFYGYKMIKNPRDIIPSSGFSLLGYGELDLQSDFAHKNSGWVISGNAFVPLLRKLNTGIRINTAILIQNSPSIFGLDSFKPKGWENAYLDDDVFMRYGLKIVQPILFPDNGFVVVPAFARAVYLYSFAEHLHRASDFGDNVSSVGGGVGIKFRLFHHFDFDFTFGAAYRPKDHTWKSHAEVLNEN